ncbi:MAG: thrombospondin type 3 repeat-containing protein [Flavobacteriales bacterium]|nr:thrombospondin type 3 repeat-containing protein [Flavobacteriales bacterium]
MWYADTDNDGFGSGAPVLACVAPPAHVANNTDNCPSAANPGQEDSDNDSVGDACDNCVSTPNTDQADADGDGDGDVCDNCVTTPNADQADGDGDGDGDVCDNCVTTPNADQANADGDIHGDVCDNCASVANNDQADDDGDLVGNACDNCPNDANPTQADADNDSLGDACDACPNDANNDSDGDLICGDVDTCPTYPGQVGDFCDADPGPGYSLGQIGPIGVPPYCGCQPVACNISVRLVLATDGAASIGWSIYQQGSNVLVHQSAPFQYPATPGGSFGNVCLPDGDFYLVVTSTGNGMGPQGGYRLERPPGCASIDNSGNFTTGTISQIAGGQGFTLPVGTDRSIHVSCDKMDWRSNEYIVANPNTAVSDVWDDYGAGSWGARPRVTRCGSTTPTVATASAASTAMR